jgi:flagellar biosynthetic protein FliP
MRRALWLAPLLLVLLAGRAAAQQINIDLGDTTEGPAAARIFQLTALIGFLAAAPSLLVMVTAFARIVIVLALLRSAIGAQGVPPNTVLIGLALFLTFFVMQPALEAAWVQGIEPMGTGRVGELEGLRLAAEPFRRFMLANLRGSDLTLFLDLARLPPPPTPDQAPWRALIPAFVVGELRRAFEIGFMIYVPFLVIDLVVASVLMSMGMMMLPPVTIALPFKLVFFVLVDGWRLVSGSLAQGFLPG